MDLRQQDLATDDAAASVREALVLAVVLAAAFMAILDIYIVNVAVPSIRRGLGASFGNIELVVSGYTITYACLLITGGRIGDLLGRKRVFIAGLALFSLCSGICGAAPSAGVLIAARACQGIGAALFYPQVLALIRINFHGPARDRALGAFGATIGIAVACGQIVGGALIAADLFGWGWRPIFLVNVPVGMAVVLAALVWLPDEPAAAGTRVDLSGVVAVAATLFCLDVPLLTGRDYGWPTWMLVCLGAAAPLALMFVAVERRVARIGSQPLVRLDLFADRGFTSGTLISGLFMLVQGGYLFVLAVYLQTGIGFTPLQAGIISTPSAIGFFAVSLVAARLSRRFGRAALAAGYVVAALGLLAASLVAGTSGAHPSGPLLALALLPVGTGQGLGFTPLMGRVVAGLRPSDAGAGSGIVSTSLQVGSVLGVASVSLLFFDLLGDHRSARYVGHAFAHTIPAAATLYFVAAVLVFGLPKQSTPR